MDSRWCRKQSRDTGKQYMLVKLPFHFYFSLCCQKRLSKCVKSLFFVCLILTITIYVHWYRASLNGYDDTTAISNTVAKRRASVGSPRIDVYGSNLRQRFSMVCRTLTSQLIVFAVLIVIIIYRDHPFFIVAFFFEFFFFCV